MTITQEQINEAINLRKSRFKGLLARAADGQQIDMGELLDAAAAVKVESDQIPEHLERVKKRRRLQAASQVAPDVIAQREELLAEVRQLDEAEQERLHQAETQRLIYERLRRETNAKIGALDHHFRAAESARNRLHEAVDPLLKSRADEIESQRRLLINKRHFVESEIESLKTRNAADHYIASARRPLIEIEKQLADLDAELETLRTEMNEIL